VERLTPSLSLTILLIAHTASAQVSGTVRDQFLAPVADARVTLQASDIATTTAADGTFNLPEAIGSGLVIVAAREGYYNRSVTVDSPVSDVAVVLTLVPQDDDPGYVLVPPSDCGGCHPAQYSDWLDSPMAEAGFNVWVQDIYSGTGTTAGMGGFVYLRDSVFAHSNPSSECASCHQPEVWLDNPFGPLVDPLVSTPPGVVHGVSCDVCHKIAHLDVTKVNFPGIYPGAVTFTRPQGPAFNQVQYGVLGDVDYVDPSSMRASYNPQLTAETCAACHQDKNDPDEDGDFEDADGVISEPTYLEWYMSPFGDPASPYYATCVDCHMPPAGITQACNALIPPLVRDPSTLRSHRIEGTTPAFLENAVELSLTAGIVGETLNVEAAITNSLTGHHVPTGVTVRNMILLVEAWREDDGLTLTHTGSQTVHPLGGVGDPTQGYYSGLPGKFYSKVNHDATGAGPTFFTDATGIEFDNRIPALATDLTSYTFAVPPGDGTLRVRARLIYRRAFRFLVDAKQWTVTGQGDPLPDVQAPHYGHLMEEAERTVLAVSCEGQPAGASCADGNVCNGDETCNGAGTCQPGVPLDCDDGNECTDDGCDPIGACTSDANMHPCDDGDACTAGDVCSGSACVGGPPVACDDGNPCTDDGCDPLGGCTYVPNSAPCDDGTACTAGDTCSGGACVGGPRLDCDDGSICTQDLCDPIIGCINAEEPATGCLAASRVGVHVRDDANDGLDQLRWKWQKGGETTQGDLGTPDATTTYALCVYDAIGGERSLASALRIDPDVHWIDKAPRGWIFRDATASQSGIRGVRLSTGGPGRSKALLHAKGADIPLPMAPGARFFEVAPSVIVQLHSDEAPVCWTSEFFPADVKRNSGREFKASAR
jgi:hypothetical protein